MRLHTHGPFNSSRRSINWDVQHRNDSKTTNGDKTKTEQRWDFDLQTWAAQRHAQACTEPESARGQRSCTALDAGRRSPDGVKSTRRRVFLIIAAIRRCQYQPPTLNYCASHKYSPHALSLDSGRQTYNKNNKKNMKKSINKYEYRNNKIIKNISSFKKYNIKITVCDT